MAYYDYIRIYGLPDSDKEVFQGLGAAAMYNAKAAQPVSGGDASTTVLGGGTATTLGETDASIQAVWNIQNEWIDAEITRLQGLLAALEQAEITDLPDLTDGSRGLWSSLVSRLSLYAGSMILPLTQAAIIISAISDTIAIGEFVYSIYKRFWVGKETLKHLPAALIQLCKMTIDMLRKLRDIPQTAENFEMRELMVTNLTERFEQQFQFYLTDFTGGEVSTISVSTEQITQTMDNLRTSLDALKDGIVTSTTITEFGESLTGAIKTLTDKQIDSESLITALNELAYRDQDIDFGGVRVSLRSKVVTEP